MLVSRAKFEDIKFGEPYWMLDHNRNIYEVDMFRNWVTDPCRFIDGNYFKTKEDALRCQVELKTYNLLQVYSTEFVSGSENWYIYYDYEKSQVEYGCTTSIKHCDLYFKSKEDAMMAVEAVTLDCLLKYYLDIEPYNFGHDCSSSLSDDLEYLHRKYVEKYHQIFE